MNGAKGAMHTETQPMDRAVLKLVLALEIPSVIIVLALLSQTQSAWWIYLIVLAGLALGPLLIGLMRLVVRVDGNEIRWAFSPFARGKVAMDDIEHIEVVEVKAFPEFGGWGPKWRPGRLGMIAKSGGAVEITRRSKKTKIVLTSDDADRLADEILRRLLREEGIPMTETGV